MTIGVNYTNNNLEQLLTQINSYSGQLGLGSSYSGSLFNLLQGEEVTVQEQTNLIQKGAELLLKLIDKLVGKKEAGEAVGEINSNSQAADKLTKEQRRIVDEYTEIAGGIETSVNEQIENLQKAQNELNETQKAIEEEQKRINAELEAIADLQKQLSDAENTDKLGILQQIQEKSTALKDSMNIIAVYQATMKEQSEIVAKIVQSVAELGEQSTQITENTQSELSSISVEYAQEVKENIATAKTGAGNLTTAAQVTAAATAASTNPITGVGAAKLYQVAADQTTAGTTRTTGVVSPLTKLAQGIGQYGSDLQAVANLGTKIGSLLSAFDGNVVGWNTTLDSVITSIGSFREVETSVDALVTAVGNDIAIIETKNEQQNNNGQAVEDNQNQCDLESLNITLKNFKLS